MTSQMFGNRQVWSRYVGAVSLVALLACGGSEPVEPEPTPDPVTPIAHSQRLERYEGAPITITLAGEAGPDDTLSFTVEEGPQHGVLEGTAPELTYVPDEGFHGFDVFSFSVNVGERRSTTALVVVEVLSAPYYSITRGAEDRESLLHYTGPRGEVTEIGATGHALISLKFDPSTGVLYAATRGRDFEGRCDNCLVTLNPETGAATVVGPLDADGSSYGPMPSLAFLSDGSLYGVTEASDDLVKIDKATGAVTPLENSALSTWGHGMWTTPDDTLWFINGDAAVYTLDPLTGLATPIHEASVLAEQLPENGDPYVRGDRNPYTGAYVGVIALDGMKIGQTRIDAEQARYIRSTEGPHPLTHNLAFAPRAQ